MCSPALLIFIAYHRICQKSIKSWQREQKGVDNDGKGDYNVPIANTGGERLKNKRNTLNGARVDAKEFVKLIEKLPENKKAEVLGIIRGYSLCAETENKEKEHSKQ